MSGKSGSTFGKLQRERARREKQLEKQARKQQRKLDKQNRVPGEDSSESLPVETTGELLPASAPTESGDQ